MAGFEEIVGHTWEITQLKNAVKHQHVSHAYIIEGPEGSGKKTLAKAFAAALLCEEKTGNACGRCLSCRKLAANSHPDVIFLQPEGKTYKVEDIRQRLNADIVVKPYESERKIYILDRADELNAQSQNALLKTLEEPPAYGLILLLAQNADTLLPTIRSRCIRLPLRPLEDAQIRESLQKRGLSKEDVDACTAFAQGVLGRAQKLAASEQFKDSREQIVSLLKQIDTLGFYEQSKRMEQIFSVNDDTDEILDIFYAWFRDVLLIKASGDTAGAVFGQEKPILRRQAGRYAYTALDEILRMTETMRVRVGVNINKQLCMEELLATIKEKTQ